MSFGAVRVGGVNERPRCQNLPAVSRAVQAAVVAAHLGAGAAHGAGSAGAGARRLVQHGQVGGRGVCGGPLRGCAP